MSSGVLSLFLALLDPQDAEVGGMVFRLWVWVCTLCEQSLNGALWTTLGVSRANAHVIMDYVSSHCGLLVVTEELVRFLLEQIMNTQQLEENGEAEWSE